MFDFKSYQLKLLRRLLISQDRHEIYVIVARYGTKYMDYVTRNADPGNEFLEMTEYGAYDTRTRDAMEELGILILAFVLQECPKT